LKSYHPLKSVLPFIVGVKSALIVTVMSIGNTILSNGLSFDSAGLLPMWVKGITLVGLTFNFMV